ncbi:ElyC/SanA/YdcF family protein [Halomonas halodenitrificans]|uniref:ElyC/SanA/YdcF family protein n=1 Tax=Halomonas halodenitrificans TaxID=28252 RepID=UPI000484FEF1|nr:ElyC/SanA/YdcF family protein [Halomonas halodenitrificans]
MYDLLKVLVANLLMPLPVSLGLGALGLLLLRWRRLGGVVIAVGLGILLLASWPPVADRLLAPLESRHSALGMLPEDPDLAAVVVLGGGWEPDSPRSTVGRLSDSSALRLVEGIRLWRQRPELPLIVTGASRDPEVAPVALGYAAAAVDLGVPAARLVVLDSPTDTGREARAVSDALGEGSRVVVVTSASHMPRAMYHFRQAGLEPLAAPTHYLARHQRTGQLQEWVPSASELRKTERALYETLGLLAVGWEH